MNKRSVDEAIEALQTDIIRRIEDLMMPGAEKMFASKKFHNEKMEEREVYGAILRWRIRENPADEESSMYTAVAIAQSLTPEGLLALAKKAQSFTAEIVEKYQAVMEEKRNEFEQKIAPYKAVLTEIELLLK